MASYLDKTGLTTLWSKIKNSFLPLGGGGTITGTLNVSSAHFGSLSVTRSGSSYYAGIQFVNDAGTLGSVGMTAVDDALYRLSADTSKAYKILDGSNWSSYAMAVRPASIELYPSSSAGHGGYIDFHYNGSSVDSTSRIIEQASGELAINGIAVKGSQITGSLNGNAASATKATQDGSGNTITSTYLKLSGGTLTGTIFTRGAILVMDDTNSTYYAMLSVNAKGTTSVTGQGRLMLGNDTATGNDGNARGFILLYSNGTAATQIWSGATTSYNYYFQTHGNNNSVYSVAAATQGAVGSTSTPVYINANGIVSACGSLEAAILKSSSTPTYGINGLQYFNASLSTSDTANGTISYAPTNDWWHILRMNHGNGSGYYVDIGACFHQDYLAYRRVSNGTDSGWVRILDEKTGLLKSGGTMTGQLNLASGLQLPATGTCGLNANNSDIIGVNGLYFADISENTAEGINFYRTASTWDNITAQAGIFYFGSNLGAKTALTANATVRAGNFGVYSNNYPSFTINNTSGQRLVTLFQTSNTGGFGSFTVRVYSAANTYTDASFGSDGYLYTKGLTLSNINHGPLTIERSGTTYYASVRFKNSLGTLGYIGMTAVNGSLVRLCTDTTKAYKIPEVRGWDGSTLTLGTD